MDDQEIQVHTIGSIGPQANGSPYVAHTDPEAVSFEQDGSEEDQPDYLRYVPYPQSNSARREVWFNS